MSGVRTWPANGKAGASEWTEYAVRYLAPAEFVGLVAEIRTDRASAEAAARGHERSSDGAFKCEVVTRTVTTTEWWAVSS